MSTTDDFDMLPFDRDRQEHQAFVYDTFRQDVREFWPWREMSEPQLMSRFKRELASPGTETRIITVKRSPNDFAGWLAARAQPRPTVVYGYVKRNIRRWGIATTALIALGLDPVAGPIGVLFWTPACARIVRDSPPWRLYFDTTEER